MLNENTITINKQVVEVIDGSLIAELTRDLTTAGYHFDIEQGRHWSHQQRWCHHNENGRPLTHPEMRQICAQAIGMHYSHFLYADRGCLGTYHSEDKTSNCPIALAVSEIEQMDIKEFQQLVVGQTDGGRILLPDGQTQEIVVTENGTTLINGEESLSPYLTRREGAPVHPNCHCRIPYQERRRLNECTGDCPCFHRFPIVAYILLHRDGTYERMTEGDDGIIKAARNACLAELRLGDNV